MNSTDKRDEYNKKANKFQDELIKLTQLHNKELTTAIKNGEKKEALELCDKIEAGLKELAKMLPDVSRAAQKTQEKIEKRVQFIQKQYDNLKNLQMLLEQRRQEISTMRMMINRVKSKFQKDDDESVSFNV